MSVKVESEKISRKQLFQLVLGGVLKFEMQGTEQTRDDLARDDNALPGRSERVVAAHHEQAV